MIASAEFWMRAEQAVRVLNARPEIAATVQAEVDEFYARHAGLERTRLGEAFIAALVIERLSDSPAWPAAQSSPNPATEKNAA